MKGPRNPLLAVVFVFAFSALAFSSATDVYITPDGKAQGVCNTNPQSPAWFNSSANWGSGSNQIGPGTTAHLCGTFTSQMTVQGSGSNGSPITILFEAGAKISIPVCDSVNGCLSLSGRSFIIVDGGSGGIIENTANGTTRGNKLPSNGITARPCNNCEIKNLTIQNIYVRTSTTDVNFEHDAMTCAKFSGSNWLIHDNVMHDAGWCLENFWDNGDTNVKIYNNDIYNVDHTWAPAGTSGSASFFYFYNNHAHDFAIWDDTTGGNGFHHDGIHAFGVTGAKMTELWIYNNLFDGDIGSTATGYIFLEGGSGVGYTPWTDGTGIARIFNNVFVATNRQVYGLVQVHRGNGVQVFNNYVIGRNDSSCIDIDDVTNLNLENNISTTCATLIYLHDGTTLAAGDYNLYANSGSNAFVYDGKFISFNSFSTWKSSCRCDSNSSTAADAKVDVTGHPLEGSPAIGAGVNLTSVNIPALDSDKGGNIRVAPPTGWDIAAYNAGGNQKPEPPSGLAAIVN